MIMGLEAEDDYAFLSSAGKVAQAISANINLVELLGEPINWPNTLKQSLSTVLNINAPAFVCWGQAHIFFPNDAFIAHFQLDSAETVGKSFIDLPFFNSLIAVDDIKTVLNAEKNNLVKNNLSISPLKSLDGNIQGVLGICLSNTETEFNATFKTSELCLHEVIAAVPFPAAVYIGEDMKIAAANKLIKDIWQAGDDVIGKFRREVLPDSKELSLVKQLTSVYKTGKPVYVSNQNIKFIINNIEKEFYYTYRFTPLKNYVGSVYGVLSTCVDVTDLHNANNQIISNEQNFKNMVLQMPVATCLLLGPNHLITLVNTEMLNIWGVEEIDVLNKPIFEALIKSGDASLKNIASQVYQTGTPYQAIERPIVFEKEGKSEVVYENFVCEPYRSNSGEILGILVTVVNVTEQVLARKELRRTYEQSNLAKEAAQIGTFDLDLVTLELEWDKRCRIFYGINDDRKVSYQTDFLDRIFPDDYQNTVRAITSAINRKDGDGHYDVLYRVVPLKDGEELTWLRATGKVYFDNDGVPVRFIGSLLDVTEQQQKELRLKEIVEKQARLAAIVDSSEDIIISKQLDGTITSWNKAAERTFGYTANEIIGEQISKIIPTDRIDEENFIISQIVKGKKVDQFDTVRIAKDGTQHNLSLTVSPMFDFNGRVIGASKIARDISGQLRAKEAALNYTKNLEIINIVIKAISEELDLNSVLQKVTDATTTITGAKFGAFYYSKTESNDNKYSLFTFSGASKAYFEELNLPKKLSIFADTFYKRQAIRINDVRALFHFKEGNDETLVSYLAVPVISRSGHTIGGLIFGHSESGAFTSKHENLVVAIASQAAIGIDNAMLFETVKELNDKKDEFIGLASHELKTPLASINGYIQILERIIHDDKAQRFLNKAGLQVRKLTSLVNDLLDVSKIEAGKLKLTIEPFDLKLVLDEAIELVRDTINIHEILLLNSPASCWVSGDSQRVEQVIINLLSNAIKYSPDANRVEVNLYQNKDNVTVAIKDFGLGIDNEKFKSLFSRFYRIEEATPNISGLGIGLYLSNEIISRHNGKIWVESELGKGSTFWFSLPV